MIDWAADIGHEGAGSNASPKLPTVLRFRHVPDGTGVSRLGEIRPGHPLLVEYDPARLIRSRAAPQPAPLGKPDVVAHVRFHPGGELYSSSVVDRAGAKGPTTLVPKPFQLTVPPATERVELWFQLIDGTGRVAWDSRYGQNYWFEAIPEGLPVPEPSVEQRPDSIADARFVRVATDAADKDRPVRGQASTHVLTVLRIEAWVADADAATDVWADVHVFDGGSALVQTRTLALRYANDEDGGARFVWDDAVYRGTGGGSGMGVTIRPDAHTVQYRVYARVHDQIITDGILHELELPADDAVCRSPLPGRRPGGTPGP